MRLGELYLKRSRLVHAFGVLLLDSDLNIHKHVVYYHLKRLGVREEFSCVRKQSLNVRAGSCMGSTYYCPIQVHL